ncbi:hypothetical protein [Streptomyces sp. UH6]|uniref:hypothetical protein n=1 Tax=Streptomyces sp. UH6 TaxID=2748379 RepID=UPI0015D48BC8|nr:hypothetical protein [Streptomyces sp. UH6]NYV74026.1 hypothetical protein [Streptomyces sp. UH6]
MTENDPSPDTEAQNAAARDAGTHDAGTQGAGAVENAVAVPPAERKSGRRGRRVAAVTGAALLALAVVGVSGFTVVTVRGADRDPGKPVWEHQEPAAGKKERAAEAEGLRGMLLTYEESTLAAGPDMNEFGSDTELTGKEAAELVKESFADLPRTQRKQLEREVDKRHIKGIAMRSYAYAQEVDESAYALEIVLTQVEGDRSAQEDAKAERKVFQALKELGVFTAGPKVPGHGKNAWCYVLKADKEGQNESVFCVGHQGEVQASLSADGPRPIDKKDIAGLFGKQLDRIETPGEAV